MTGTEPVTLASGTGGPVTPAAGRQRHKSEMELSGDCLLFLFGQLLLAQIGTTPLSLKVFQ